MFEQAAIAVQDEKGYAKLHSLFDQAFDVRDVEVLLKGEAHAASDSRLCRGVGARIFRQGSASVV